MSVRGSGMSGRGPTRWWRGVRVGVVTAVAAASVTVIGVGPAVAAPGTPGTPQAPVTVFTEDFENGQGAAPALLTSYVGAPPLSETYTADPAWLTNCNGWVASQLNPATPPVGSGCGGSWPSVKQLAGVLGQWAGGDPATNHAVSAYTAGNPGADRVQLETVTPIPVSATNRFLTFSVDAAEQNCFANHALLKFYLLDGATAIPTFTTPIEPCADPDAIIGGTAVGTYAGNNAVLFSGSQLGIRLINGQGSGAGNDAAFDNIRVLDATPQLDLAFGAAVVPLAATVALTYTITNTTELARKNGWSFTNTLPGGLGTVPGSTSTTCSGGTVSATPSSVTISGNLDAGQASCTATVRVRTSTYGTYTDCAANITASVGINPPGCTSVYFNAPPVPNAGGPYAGEEGIELSLAGSVADPDGPGLTTTWAIAPQSPVDPGTSCVIADPSSPLTTVTCNDDGVFDLTFTANDGLNPPVTTGVTVTVANVAPHVSFSAPAGPILINPGTVVTFTAPFTDVGTNDTHTCTLNFDDGTPITPGTVSQLPGEGTCSSTHTFTALGPHLVLVRVVDDDGTAATAVTAVVVYIPGEAFAVHATGLLPIAKTPHATCPPNESLILSGLNTALGTIDALTASCSVDLASATIAATASVAGTNLLGGLVKVNNIESSCVAGPGGIVRTSRVGSINGMPIGLNPGVIGIPGVAQVFYNENTSSGGVLGRNAIRIQTILGQQIILAGCRLG